jgi:hypothetical protein
MRSWIVKGCLPPKVVDSRLCCCESECVLLKTCFVMEEEVKVKVMFTLEQATKNQRGSRGIVLLFNLGAEWEYVVNVTPRPLYPQERPCTRCTRGWVGRSAGLDGCRKPPPHLSSIPETVQPVATWCTHYAVSAQGTGGCYCMIFRRR